MQHTSDVEAANAALLADISEALRTRGWIVPAYPMPPALDDLDVLRVVVRSGFSPDLADLLLDDLRHKTALLAGHGAGPSLHDRRVAFHH